MEETLLIKDYFKGKNIFITGGTGFLGKALIEKLLRSCPDLNKIYVLVRPKKGRELYERVDDIVSNPLFRILKKQRPENIKKIVPIAGDTTELRLGISDEDKQLLLSEVHVFFHGAASVRFDNFLKVAIIANLRCAREAALLALEMKQLEVFMDVSTTYCNIDNKKVVEEILYAPQGDWKEAIKIAEHCEPELLNVLSPKYIGCFPNTYTYTKHLAEHCINDLLVGKVATIILRPAVVMSTILEPYQGWSDNFNGPVGLFVATGHGLLRTIYCNPQAYPNYIPVDEVIKEMIVAVWYKASFGNRNELSIYNSSSENELFKNYTEIVEISKKVILNVRVDKRIWLPRSSLAKCWYNYYIQFILFHILPAVILDNVTRVAGYSPMLFTIQKKIYVASMALYPFMINEWEFINNNIKILRSHIPKVEMYEFNFSYAVESKKIKATYFLSLSTYASEYLLKQGKSNPYKTYIKNLRMYYLDLVCHWIFYILATWFIFFRVNILAVIWELLYNYFDNL